MSDRPLRIARATPADAATVRELSREFAAHEGSLADLRITEERWRELLGDDDVTVLVATRDGDAIGYLSAVRMLHLWSGREIVALDDLFVRPRARNAGVGTALMRAVADRTGGRAIRWEMEEGNLSAQRFHLRLGAGLRRTVTAWWQP